MIRSDLHDLFRPRPDHRLRNAGIVAAAFLLIAAVAGVVAVVRHLSSECGTGVASIGGECVGVTDGSYLFDPGDPAYVRAESCVKAENDWVEKQTRPSVTVAFLGPLTSTSTQGLTAGRVPQEVEGACTAQHRVNQDGLTGDRPLVRLLLANEGSNEGQWRYVVTRIEGMVAAPDHLVAVIGLGLSQTETVRSVKALSDAGIPMVGDVITADGLDSTGAGLMLDGRPVGALPGLTRVAPTTGDEVKVLGRYLPQDGPLRSAMLVFDTNAGDLYTSGLGHDFRDTLGAYLRAGGDVEEPFDGNDPGNEFAVIARNLCGIAPPDMVLYAGRETYLPQFLKYLSNRPCRTKAITVVTGSDASALTLRRDVRGYLQAAPITVLYTPLASPMALDRPDNPSRSEFTSFQKSFQQLRLPVADLNDGWGIMSHDALLTATIAIRNAVGEVQGVPDPGAVRAQLYLLNVPTNNVQGAGGAFQIDQTTGNPVGRQLAVFRLGSTGTPEFRGLYRSP